MVIFSGLKQSMKRWKRIKELLLETVEVRQDNILARMRDTFEGEDVTEFEIREDAIDKNVRNSVHHRLENWEFRRGSVIRNRIHLRLLRARLLLCRRYYLKEETSTKSKQNKKNNTRGRQNQSIRYFRRKISAKLPKNNWIWGPRLCPNSRFHESDRKHERN